MNYGQFPNKPRPVKSLLVNSFKTQWHINTFYATLDELHPIMIHRKFGSNRTYGLGGDVKNVFFKKFKMAENLVRRTLVVPEAFL